MANLKEKCTAWIERHERLASVSFFAGGFILDSLTLQRIDRAFDITLLFSWLFVAAGSIALFHVRRSERFSFFRRDAFEKWIHLAIPLSFGALFSGFTVFYMRSASFAASWPFLLLVVGLFVGNEFFKERYRLLNFQITVLFIVVFFLLIFFVPIVLGKMGGIVFLFSGAISLAVIGAFIHFLYFMLPREAHGNRRALILSIAGVYLSVNVMYFGNIIPPIPLSLKDAGVYHSVERGENGVYILLDEHSRWYDRFLLADTLRLRRGDPAFVYSAVFAPTDLSTPIVHSWSYYDKKTGVWKQSAKIRFSIYGGNDRGYRGFSEKTNVFPGEWKVDVTTERGQVLGSVRFRIVYSETLPEMRTVLKR